MSDPQPQKKPNVTVKKFFVLWMESMEARCLSPNTLENYRRSMEPFIAFLESDKPDCNPDDVESSDIRRWLVKRRNEGISSHTLHGDFRKPRTFWNWLLYEELTDNNPFAKLQPPKRDKVIRPDLRPEEVEAILAACDAKDWWVLRDRAAVLLLMDTGLRSHEAHKLSISDIQDDSLIIRGKGGKHRFVYLSAEVRLAIHRYIRKCPYAIVDGKPIWLGLHGKPVTNNGFQQIIRTVGERAGVVPLGPHRLRRTFATWTLRSGCDIETLRQLMGHSSLSVLQGYLALVESDLKKAHGQHSPLNSLARHNVTRGRR